MSHDHSATKSAPGTALLVTLGLTAAFAIFELLAGLAFKSLALTADAVHMGSDTLALGGALIAQHISHRPVSDTHTFGWRRAEVLAAFVNGLLLVAVCLWILQQAVSRLDSGIVHTQLQNNATGLVLVALSGLSINLFCTYWLRRKAAGNINLHAASLHTLSDAAGSVVALIVGVVLLLDGPSWIDPVASIIITLLVLLAASHLIRSAARVLLEASPTDLDARSIERALEDDPKVMRVHHMHVWSLAPGTPALSAHVELTDVETLHQAQSEGFRLKQILVDRFNLHHATLELECHPCDPAQGNDH